MVKRITVKTNDKNHPNLQLVVKGKVKKFATVRPKRVRLNGVAGSDIRQTVAIIPEKDYPFQVVATSARRGEDIRFTLTEKKGENGPEYQVVVENIRQTVGRYSDAIILKTDHKEKSEIEVRVYGSITAPKNQDKTDPESTLNKKKTTSDKKKAGGEVKIKMSKKAKTESPE